MLHISPDGGNGSLEFLIVAVGVLAVVLTVVAARRHDFLRMLLEYLEQMGKREHNERFDN